MLLRARFLAVPTIESADPALLARLLHEEPGFEHSLGQRPLRPRLRDYSVGISRTGLQSPIRRIRHGTAGQATSSGGERLESNSRSLPCVDGRAQASFIRPIRDPPRRGSSSDEVLFAIEGALHSSGEHKLCHRTCRSPSGDTRIDLSKTRRSLSMSSFLLWPPAFRDSLNQELVVHNRRDRKMSLFASECSSDGFAGFVFDDPRVNSAL